MSQAPAKTFQLGDTWYSFQRAIIEDMRSKNISDMFVDAHLSNDPYIPVTLLTRMALAQAQARDPTSVPDDEDPIVPTDKEQKLYSDFCLSKQKSDQRYCQGYAWIQKAFHPLLWQTSKSLNPEDHIPPFTRNKLVHIWQSFVTMYGAPDGTNLFNNSMSLQAIPQFTSLAAAQKGLQEGQDLLTQRQEWGADYAWRNAEKTTWLLSKLEFPPFDVIGRAMRREQLELNPPTFEAVFARVHRECQILAQDHAKTVQTAYLQTQSLAVMAAQQEATSPYKGSKQNFQKPSPSKPNTGCYNCGQQGHQKSQCPNKPKTPFNALKKLSERYPSFNSPGKPSTSSNSRQDTKPASARPQQANANSKFSNQRKPQQGQYTHRVNMATEMVEGQTEETGQTVEEEDPRGEEKANSHDEEQDNDDPRFLIGQLSEQLDYFTAQVALQEEEDEKNSR